MLLVTYMYTIRYESYTDGWVAVDDNIIFIYIREYGSTLYVGMARKKNGRPYISIANGKLKSLVIYTNK